MQLDLWHCYYNIFLRVLRVRLKNSSLESSGFLGVHRPSTIQPLIYGWLSCFGPDDIVDQVGVAVLGQEVLSGNCLGLGYRCVHIAIWQPLIGDKCRPVSSI